MHAGRIIIYIILIGIMVLMLYAGIRIGAKYLIGLAGAGIIFLGYNLFANPDK